MHLDVWQCAVIETGLPRLSSATWAESSPKQHLCKFPLSFICNLNKITNESHIQHTCKVNSASPTMWNSYIFTLSSEALLHTASSSSRSGNTRGMQGTIYQEELGNSCLCGILNCSEIPETTREFKFSCTEIGSLGFALAARRHCITQ